MENHLLISGRIKLSWVWHNTRRLFFWTVSCLFHFMKRPYRQDVPAIGYKAPHANILRRVHDTCYDGVWTVLLNSYVELSGEALIPSTGQMFIFLLRLVRRLDEYLDAAWLKSGSLPELDELLEAPLIKKHLKTLEQYAQCFDRAEPIMAYLSKAFMDFYAPYIQSFTKAKKDGMFEDILMAAHFDSGTVCCIWMDVVGLFNQSKLDKKARHDFYLFGMITKFIDDMLDIIRDIKEGSPNLLYALVSNCSSELATFTSAMHDHNCLGARWWRKHCPSTYQQYYQHIVSYYNQVQSAGVRFACDLVMLSAVFNLNIDELRLWTSNVSRLPLPHMLYSTLIEKPIVKKQ